MTKYEYLSEKKPFAIGTVLDGYRGDTTEIKFHLLKNKVIALHEKGHYYFSIHAETTLDAIRKLSQFEHVSNLRLI